MTQKSITDMSSRTLITKSAILRRVITRLKSAPPGLLLKARTSKRGIQVARTVSEALTDYAKQLSDMTAELDYRNPDRKNP